MPAAFLHGVEIIESTLGPAPIQIIKSSVIGLVGRAPMWAAAGAIPLWNPKELLAADAQRIDTNGNLQQVAVAGTTGAAAPDFAEPDSEDPNPITSGDGTVTWQLVKTKAQLALTDAPTLVASLQAAAAFGPLMQGYDIPYALAAIFEQGAGQVIVVNVFDQLAHSTAIAATAFTFPASGSPQVISLGHMGISNVGVTDSTGATTYVAGVDFAIDYVNGTITRLTGGAIAAGATIKVAFNYADPTKVEAANIVGAFTDGEYTGIQALNTTFQTMGFFAQLFIAPGWSDQLTVAAALDAMAQKLGGYALVDSSPNLAIATALANRGTAGQAFNTSSKRTILCYPQEMFYDTGIVPTGITIDSYGNPVQQLANQNNDSPYSQWVAGTIAAVDAEFGYWYSPSNHQVEGIVGPDVSMYSSATDPTSDSNNLNAAGILTVFNAYGTGLRVWGNRSAAYPSATTMDVFIPVRRVMDAVEESVELAMLQFMDEPISNALITAILQSVNAFILSLVQRGALVAGSASYDPADNPDATVMNGQLVFAMDLTPPSPLERITWKTNLDPAPLGALGATAAQAAA